LRHDLAQRLHAVLAGMRMSSTTARVSPPSDARASSASTPSPASMTRSPVRSGLTWEGAADLRHIVPPHRLIHRSESRQGAWKA
jgi:hypothetical protein